MCVAVWGKSIGCGWILETSQDDTHKKIVFPPILVLKCRIFNQNDTGMFLFRLLSMTPWRPSVHRSRWVIRASLTNGAVNVVSVPKDVMLTKCAFLTIWWSCWIVTCCSGMNMYLIRCWLSKHQICYGTTTTSKQKQALTPGVLIRSQDNYWSIILIGKKKQKKNQSVRNYTMWRRGAWSSVSCGWRGGRLNCAFSDSHNESACERDRHCLSELAKHAHAPRSVNCP